MSKFSIAKSLRRSNEDYKRIDSSLEKLNASFNSRKFTKTQLQTVRKSLVATLKSLIKDKAKITRTHRIAVFSQVSSKEATTALEDFYSLQGKIACLVGQVDATLAESEDDLLEIDEDGVVVEPVADSEVPTIVEDEELEEITSGLEDPTLDAEQAPAVESPAEEEINEQFNSMKAKIKAKLKEKANKKRKADESDVLNDNVRTDADPTAPLAPAVDIPAEQEISEQFEAAEDDEVEDDDDDEDGEEMEAILNEAAEDDETDGLFDEILPEDFEEEEEIQELSAVAKLKKSKLALAKVTKNNNSTEDMLGSVIRNQFNLI